MRIPSAQHLKKLGPQAFTCEDELQRFVEDHVVVPAYGLQMVSSSQSGGRRIGRTDTMAIDDEGAPVIIEYKRDRVGRAAVEQVERYRQWLLSNREEFERAVLARCDGRVTNWKQIHLVTVGHRYHPSLAASSASDSSVLMLRYGFRPDKTVFIREVDRNDVGSFGDEAPPAPVKEFNQHLVKSTVYAREAFELLRNRLIELQFVETVPGKNRVWYSKEGEQLAQVTFIKGGGLQFFFAGGEDVDDVDGRASHPGKGGWKWTIGIDTPADVDYVIKLLAG